MARKTRKRPAPAAGNRSYQARDVFLAGLGAVSIGRKQVVEAYAQGVEGVADWQAAAKKAARKASEAVNGKVVALRRQAAPVRKTLGALARDASAQLRDSLAPVLARIGVKPAPKRRAPARAKKGSARRRRAA